MAIKFAGWLTDLDGLLPKKPHDRLIRWFYEIMWHPKSLYLYYHSAQGLQNLATWLTMRGLPMLLHPLVTCSCEIMWQTISMATKRGRMVTYLVYLLPIKLSDHIITWFCKIAWQTKNISTTAVPMATKLGKMMTYLEWLLPTKSYDRIIMWFCKITWQTKIIIYPLTQFLWLSIFTRWLNTMRSFLP